MTGLPVLPLPRWGKFGMGASGAGSWRDSAFRSEPAKNCLKALVSATKFEQWLWQAKPEGEHYIAILLLF